jgi:hypothetical protein
MLRNTSYVLVIIEERKYLHFFFISMPFGSDWFMRSGISTASAAEQLS